MLAELIRSNQPCIALTGAGVSTASGIPDFRSASGIWAQHDPHEVVSIEGFLRDPERAWEFYGRRLHALDCAAPNAAHDALARLDQDGWIDAIITQNVDRLHERAGSRNVIEIHGSLRTASCFACGTREPMEAVAERLPVPLCGRCETVLKPDVLMFGEQLPPGGIDQATELSEGAALLLVVGSSLEVWPVAGLPATTLSRGGKLAIVNRGATDYDVRADLVIHDSAVEIFAAAASALSSA